jgi:ubiquinone/menaquinone biosynthesis C-methylase UbiE
MSVVRPAVRSALQAREHAQWIAFGPSLFQAARVLCSSGILAEVERSGTAGITLEEVVERVALPLYGVRVLMEAGQGLDLLLQDGARYTSTKTAWFLLHDPLTRANMDFTQDVNYRGLFDLEASIRSGRPEGLKHFGAWPTIYEGLAQLPQKVRESWLAFDHYYSDSAFPAALPLVFRRRPRRLLDIGGNTGKWALACLAHDAAIEVTLVDLPGQLQMARARLQDAPGSARLRFAAADLLDPRQTLPAGFDAIWMSQFLDCFSEAQIVSILQRCRAALAADGRVYILEPLWDRQRYAAAAFCLQQTSLYFTALANGNSQMYRSTTLIAAIEAAGFRVEEEHDALGVHTLLVCRPQPGAPA